MNIHTFITVFLASISIGISVANITYLTIKNKEDKNK